MLIKTYFSEIKAITDKYSATDFVLSTILNFDIRPGDQGYLYGSVTYIDNSILYFKEFLDASNKGIEKVMYSYHYQDVNKQLIFRYDNALHKPPLATIGHKHLPDKVIEACEPQFQDVMIEICILQGWV